MTLPIRPKGKIRPVKGRKANRAYKYTFRTKRYPNTLGGTLREYREQIMQMNRNDFSEASHLTQSQIRSMECANKRFGSLLSTYLLALEGLTPDKLWKIFKLDRPRLIPVTDPVNFYQQDLPVIEGIPGEEGQEPEPAPEPKPEPLTEEDIEEQEAEKELPFDKEPKPDLPWN